MNESSGDHGSTQTAKRFLALGGLARRGQQESAGGNEGYSPPSDETVREMAGRLATAVREDPLAFEGLVGRHDDLQIQDHLSGAIEAINRDGQNASLTAPQQGALEAIVLLIGRPVLYIKNDNFTLPPGEEWEVLSPRRDEIGTVIKSVGRIGVSADYGSPYVGTGFVVAENVVMTNRHVVKNFVARASNQWVLDPGCRMRVDFKQEFGVSDKAEFFVESVILVEERANVDLALLKLAVTADRPAPPPLRLQRDAGYANEGNTIYVIGYPGSDSRRNDPTEMHRIFDGVYDKKRLAPGRVTSISPENLCLSHDCSTLGGNSGSCVVDLSTNSVIGLHFEGDYLKSNKAVLLPHLAADPRLSVLNFRDGRDD